MRRCASTSHSNSRQTQRGKPRTMILKAETTACKHGAAASTATAGTRCPHSTRATLRHSSALLYTLKNHCAKECSNPVLQLHSFACYHAIAKYKTYRKLNEETDLRYSMGKTAISCSAPSSQADTQLAVTAPCRVSWQLQLGPSENVNTGCGQKQKR